jgi:Tol biopolymer transport system component
LTDNDYNDLGPDWSTDGSRIVFSSAIGPAGNLEVTTMNADGTEIDGVTFTGADNIDPDWQPVTE